MLSGEAKSAYERARYARQKASRAAWGRPRLVRPGDPLHAILTAVYLSQPTPRTRGDCIGGPRPCPYVACRYHLYLDVRRDGAIRVYFPNISPEELEESCALDVADRGGATIEEVAGISNITRVGACQVVDRACAKLRKLGDWREW